MTIKQYISESADRSFVKSAVMYLMSLNESDLILHPDMEIPCAELKILDEFAEKHKRGIPLAYLTGSRYFYKNVFKVTEHTLIPQPDTEILVGEAVKTAKKNFDTSIKILDLCTGTGCVGISVAKELAQTFNAVSVMFSDISPKALDCLKSNVDLLITEKNINTGIICGNLFDNIPEYDKFDIIVTNPPYIESSVIPTLDSEVLHEPLLALDGGPDGLNIIRKIAENCSDYVNDKAFLLCEISFNQGKKVKNIFENNSLNNVEIIKDYAQLDRVVKGCF